MSAYDEYPNDDSGEWPGEEQWFDDLLYGGLNREERNRLEEVLATCPEVDEHFALEHQAHEAAQARLAAQQNYWTFLRWLIDHGRLEP